MVTALAIGGAELLAMILLSVYGAMKLPPGARVPLDWGGRWGSFQGKYAGLIAYPAIGAGIFVLLAILGATLHPHGRPAAFAPVLFAPIVLCVLPLTQVAAIDKARRGAADTPRAPSRAGTRSAPTSCGYGTPAAR